MKKEIHIINNLVFSSLLDAQVHLRCMDKTSMMENQYYHKYIERLSGYGHITLAPRSKHQYVLTKKGSVAKDTIAKYLVQKFKDDLQKLMMEHRVHLSLTNCGPCLINGVKDPRSKTLEFSICGIDIEPETLI